MNPGDRVRITTKDDTLEGVLMPEQPGKLLLKLDSGYNIGIDEKNIKKKELLKKHHAKKAKKTAYKTNKNKKTIAILHTGGTIASKVDYETGAVIARFTPAEILTQFPELHTLCNITSELLSNMWSEDMRFKHYNIMAAAVKKQVDKGVDGIIITHGTDTLHYTAAALSYVLENVPVPVVLVGAQRSSDRPSTDAKLNLLGATHYILEGKPGVTIAMHEHTDDDTIAIIHGCHARKDHTSTRAAFTSVNRKLVARVNKNGTVQEIEPARHLQGEFSVKKFKDIRVGLLKIHPHMHAEQFSQYYKYDGLVIEGTGLGHAPINTIDRYTKEHSDIAKALEKLCKKMPVIMSSQTVSGRINMNVYQTGRHLQDLGILGNYSTMTPETTYIKLAWLLSNHKKKVVELITSNLRGEQLTRLT